MVRIFTDFDGTITRRDVGDSFFEHFGGAASIEAVRKYLAGEISAVECFRRECDACGAPEPREIDAFLDGEGVDSSFAEFIAFCNEQGLPCTIVSDGMDYYIRRILLHHNLDHVPSLSNTLRLIPRPDSTNVRMEPSFPYQDEVCDRCASCKRNHILSQSADDDVIVYIGEGYSDRCPARYADVVFAKDALAEYCRKENISFFDYRRFSDITRQLRGMIGASPDGGNKGLKKRRRAELARKELYLGG